MLPAGLGVPTALARFVNVLPEIEEPRNAVFLRSNGQYPSLHERPCDDAGSST